MLNQTGPARKEQTLYESWKAIGDEIQEIRDRLISFMCNPNYQKLGNKELSNILSRVIDHVDKFRDKAEERMFNKVKPPLVDNLNWLNVFYGAGGRSQQDNGTAQEKGGDTGEVNSVSGLNGP